MSEAFLNTVGRDYVDTHELWSAGSVLKQLPAWIEDYRHVAPHSAHGMKTPAEYRQEKSRK